VIPNPHMIQVFNYGGGRQSVAMAILIAQGKLPRPDRIVFAHLKRERATTLPYMEWYVQPLLTPLGLRVEVAKQNDFATVDLFSHGGDVLMPMYTTQKNLEVMPEATLESGVSKLRTYCSTEWKARVLERYLRSNGIRLRDVVTWLGFSLEESRRVKVGKNGKRNPAFWYPLIDAVPVTRDDCSRIIEAAGLPLPRKSTCRGCPHQTDAEWWDTKVNHPEDFARAVEDERQMREKDVHVWMHKSAKPLELVEFDPKEEKLDAQCGLGVCFV
jgi:hypothetical protein